ncbi:MAG: CRISPR-associated endonuclease Cas2 [Abditibacteriales bacterium]|nr:CRISPR-associated endonuclease Cas2 [Abditibacteriales bacterium]
MNVIVSYDVEDDKRRAAIHKALMNFGVWTQYSLFECDLSEQQLVRLRHKLETLMDKTTDSVIIYHLCGGCHRRLERMGVSKRLLEKQDLIV